MTAFVFAIPSGAAVDAGFNAGVTKGDPAVYITKTLSDGKILVGGTFRIANGSPRSYLVRLNSDGSLDDIFNSGASGPNASVYAIAEQADGKFIIGGQFTSYNNVTRNRIARINPDGSLDASFSADVPAPSSPYISKIAVQSDGKILVSGRINNSVRRLNSDGTLDTTFTSPITFSDGVQDIAIQPDGKILIGGVFPEGILRLNTDGSADSAFAVTESHYDAYSIKLLSDGKILIGGNFSHNGINSSSIKRLNPDGSTDGSFSTGAAGIFNQTEDIEVQKDGKVLVAGHFTNDGFTALTLLRLNADGSQDNSFSIPNGNDKSLHIELQSDGKILLGGGFLSINGQAKAGIVRLNSDGSSDNLFNASFYGNALVQSIIQQPDGKLLVSGDFNFANGTPGSGIARFNLDGTRDISFDSGNGLSSDPATGYRYIYDAELQSDGKILLAGVFYGYQGHTSRGIVRLNSDGTPDTSFVMGINGGIIWVFETAVLPDGKILASVFGTDPIDGFGFSGIVKLNPDGSLGDSIPAQPNGTVRKIAIQPDGKILIGGSFASIDGNPANFIARLKADGSLDTTFNIGSGFNSTVLDIIVQPDGKILVGGAFTSFNGTPRNRIARLNPDGSLDAGFDPGTGADSTVYKLALEASGKVVLGGNFSALNGVGRNRIARLDPNGSLDAGFASGLDNDPANTVRALLLQTDGKLVLGGHFNSYDGAPRDSLARLLTNQSRPPIFDYDGDGKTDVSIFRPGPGEWWYLRSSDGGNRAFQFGSSTDKLVPADFTGDGSTDIAFWRESTGEWFVLRSEDSSFYSFPFGTTNDIPVPADYDGDGKADPAIFRPSSATWFIIRSTDGGTTIAQFGANTDLPVPADYDGDGKTDLAIFRPGDGSWWLNRSTAGLIVYNFGTGTDRTVQGDYTGDGKADVAFWRPTTGEWFILRSEDASFYSGPFGAMGDVPVPGDYDGDGRSDLAVFRPSVNTWFIEGSTVGFSAVSFGIAGDTPTPSAYVR
ncbi:MAG: hypothetical protein R2747_23570 [Pyrinomonadaceae bacterium]